MAAIPSSAEATLGELLRDPFNVYVATIHKALDAAGHGAVRPPHGQVFQFVDRGGTRLSTLAERMGVTKQAVQYLVDDLERGGYVERLPDPDDRRAKLIAPTALGMEIVHLAERRARAMRASWREALGAERYDQLVALLRQLHATATGQNLPE